MHSLGPRSSTTSSTRSGQADFETIDRAAARAVAAGAAAGGASQIVFLGGLGEDGGPLPAPTEPGAETAADPREGAVPVTTLRAAMIVRENSAAFETILALVERLPVMICAAWGDRTLFGLFTPP